MQFWTLGKEKKRSLSHNVFKNSEKAMVLEAM